MDSKNQKPVARKLAWVTPKLEDCGSLRDVVRGGPLGNYIDGAMGANNMMSQVM